jgi:hypothetical protein
VRQLQQLHQAGVAHIPARETSSTAAALVLRSRFILQKATLLRGCPHSCKTEGQQVHQQKQSALTLCTNQQQPYVACTKGNKAHDSWSALMWLAGDALMWQLAAR